MDWLQGGLDVAGCVPGLGEFADGTNALISVFRGGWTGAGLSAVSMIPVAGDAVGKGGKLARYAAKYGDDIATRHLDDLVGGAGRGVAAKGTAVAEQGGLNLYKWNHPTSTRADGWRDGDYFLNLPNQGSVRANWAQNSSRLRAEMRNGRPICDSYVDDTGNLVPTQGFLNAERNLLISRGWTFNPLTGAWHPPAGL